LEQIKTRKRLDPSFNEKDTIDLMNAFIQAKLMADEDPDGFITAGRSGRTRNTVGYRNMLWFMLTKRLRIRPADRPIPWFGWEGHPY
jgi:hypothetical protein